MPGSQPSLRQSHTDADRGPNPRTRPGWRAAAVVFAIAMVLGAVPLHATTAAASDPKPIRVTSSNLITDPGTGEPKAVLSLYEDFLCPYCGKFEKTFGATVDRLIDNGAVAADYYPVSILDTADRDYSSRAGAAAYCVADQSTGAFRRFHAALFAQQPAENAASFPDNAQLIDIARQAGAGGAVGDCITGGTYTATVRNMAQAANVEHTSTVRINGEDYQLSTPAALVARIKEIIGDVPGVDAPE